MWPKSSFSLYVCARVCLISTVCIHAGWFARFPSNSFDAIELLCNVINFWIFGFYDALKTDIVLCWALLFMMLWEFIMENHAEFRCNAYALCVRSFVRRAGDMKHWERHNFALEIVLLPEFNCIFFFYKKVKFSFNLNEWEKKHKQILYHVLYNFVNIFPIFVLCCDFSAEILPFNIWARSRRFYRCHLIQLQQHVITLSNFVRAIQWNFNETLWNGFISLKGI